MVAIALVFTSIPKVLKGFNDLFSSMVIPFFLQTY
jgi:hypothetical protein